MPTDYQLLMRQCWSTDPAQRPSVDVVLQCLQLMIDERQQLLLLSLPATARGAVDTQPEAALAEGQLWWSEEEEKEAHTTMGTMWRHASSTAPQLHHLSA
jgi:hypothetical protein